MNKTVLSSLKVTGAFESNDIETDLSLIKSFIRAKNEIVKKQDWGKNTWAYLIENIDKIQPNSRNFIPSLNNMVELNIADFERDGKYISMDFSVLFFTTKLRTVPQEIQYVSKLGIKNVDAGCALFSIFRKARMDDTEILKIVKRVTERYSTDTSLMTAISQLGNWWDSSDILDMAGEFDVSSLRDNPLKDYVKRFRTINNEYSAKAIKEIDRAIKEL